MKPWSWGAWIRSLVTRRKNRVEIKPSRVRYTYYLVSNSTGERVELGQTPRCPPEYVERYKAGEFGFVADRMPLQ